MQVHLQLMLVCGGRQLQLFLAENRLECRSGPFQTQVATAMCTLSNGLNGLTERRKKNMTGNVVPFPGDFRPPVFKIRAQIQVWRNDDHPAGGQA